MKQIRNYWLCVIALVAMVSSCMDPVTQDVSISNIRHGKKFTTNLSVASMEYDVQTKSQYSSAEDLVQNWNLFIYDAENDTRVGAYYRAADNQGTLSPMEFDVKLDHAYRYYAVANVGNVTSSAPAKDFIGGVSQMENFLLTNLGSAGDWNGVGIPSAWSGSQTFSSSTYRTNPAACVLNVQLMRLASRYSFRISHAYLNDWSLNITDFKVYGTTSAKPFSSAGYRETSTSQLPVTDYLLGVEKTFFNNASNDNAYTAVQAINKDFVFSSLNTGRPVCLYALENLCGTGSNTGGGADGWGKVPGNKPSSTNPSYVEITGTATLNDNSGASKSVTFRFYLGENEKNDYNVYRNKLYCITFTPTDESILNGHDGNWKIEPGPFSETRSLAFEHEGVRFRAGTSMVEGINKNPAALKYKVNIPSSLSANGNLVVKNGTTPVTSGSVIDAASLSLEAKDGIDAAGQLEIRTIEGLLYDVLNVEIFNAYLQVLPDTPLTWDWNEHTQKDITLTATVPWTATVPSGWSLTYASGGAVSGDQPAGSNVALKILPPTSDYTETTADASVTLSFAATGTDGDAVTLIRRYKPQVLSGGNTSSSMEWEWNEATSTGAKALSISSNEEWVIVWPAGDHSHWTVSPASGVKTVTSISVYPADINDSTNPVSATFYVVPVRGGVNVDAGKLTVNLNHKANLPYINVSGSDLDEGALKWLWYQNGSKSINVTSNIGWTASLDDNAAASFNISSNAGAVTVTPKGFNYVTSPVSGNVVLRGTGDFTSTIQNVPVSQSRYPSIAVSPDAASWLATAYDARPFVVTITAAAGETYQWAGSVANNPANTVNFSMSPASGNNSTSFTAAPASANGSSTQGNSATVTITLAGDYGSAAKPTFSVNLSQASAAPFISISPDVSSLGWHWYEGTASARKQIEVTTNVSDWEIVLEGTNASKFYCNYNSSNPNIIDIYPVNVNDGTAIDGVTLSIKSTDPSQSGLTKTVSLSQTRKPAISVSPDNLVWEWEITSVQVKSSVVTITADETYTWSAAFVSGSETFSLTNSSGNSGGSVNVSRASSNEDEGNDLTGSVRVTLVGECGGQPAPTATVSLKQNRKYVAPFLNITPNESDLTWYWDDDSDDDQTITVSSNQTWNATLSNNTHFEIVVEGNVIKVHPKGTNDTQSPYTTTLNINVPAEPSLNKTVTLTQTKKPLLNASPSPVNFPWDWTSGSETVTVTSDIDWTAALDANGSANFTITGNSGSGNGTITVSPKGQNTDEVNPKTGKIIFTGVGAHNTGVSCEVDLNQYKKTAFNVSPLNYNWTGTDVTHKTITVTASGSWSVTPPTGYSASVTGGSGNGSFEVWPTSPNNTYSDQTAVTMAVTSGSNTINVTLQQLAKVKEYTSAYFRVEGSGSYGFHERNGYNAYIIGVYDGDQEDYLEDVSSEVTWSCSGGFTSYIESSQVSYGTYYVQVYNTSTSALSGHVNGQFSGGWYEGFYVSGTTDYVDVSVDAYPYISASDVTVDWDNTSGHYNYSANVSVSASGVASWASFSSYSGIRATSSNSDTNPRSCTITLSGSAWDWVTYEQVQVSDSFTFTQEGKPAGPEFIRYEYKDLSVSISASSTSIPYTGGSSTLSYSATWQVREVWTDGPRSWTSDSATPTVSGSATGFSRSGTSVTVSENTSTSSRSVTYTASYTLPTDATHVVYSGSASDSDDVTIEQDGKPVGPTFLRYEYKDLSVSISASSTSIPYTGGSSTLSYSATWQVREVWTDGPRSWTSDSATPTVSGSATGFSRSGTSVTVSENTSTSSRSVTYTASYTLPTDDTHVVYSGSASDSDDVTIEQDPKPNVTYSNFTVSLSPTSIGEGESSTATATIDKYINGSFSETINVTSYTTFDATTNASRVTKSGNTFGWNGNTSSSYNVNIQGTMNHGEYGSRSGSETLTVEKKADEVTYSNFSVSLSPTSISEGESSTATATIDKYVNGSFSETIDVTSSTTFSATTNSSRVSKTGSNTFLWNGTTTSSYNVIINGSLSSSTYGSASKNATLTVNQKKVLNYISLDRSSYSLTYANLWTMNYTVTAYYSDNSSETVTSVASVISTPSGISMDPTSGTLHAHDETSGTIKVSYGGKEATATASAVDSWFLQGLEVSGLDGSASAGSQFNFKIVGSYIKHLSFSEGTSSTIHQEANSISGDLSYINIDWNGSDEYQVSFKGSTPVNTTRSITLKYINPREPGWTDNYIDITIYFKKRQSSWEYTGFDTNDN